MSMERSPPVLEWPGTRSGFDLGLAELVEHRHLIATLAKRDLRGLYQQSMLGLFWRIFPTLFAMGGYSLIFGLFGQVKLGGDLPYFLVLYCGLMPWMIFSTTLSAVVHSVVANAALIKKAYFPRLIAPLVSLADKLIDVIVGFTVLVIMLLIVKVPLGPGLLLALAYIVWGIVLAFSIGLWLAWLHVLLRDVGHGIPVAMQALFYLSPIVYPSSAVPAAFRTVYKLNPIVALVDGVRWQALGVGQPPGWETLWAVGLTVILLVGGLWFFRRVEGVLMDVL